MIPIEKIRNILPHRYPFLLVDRVLDIDLDKNEIKCIKNISINEPQFQGHFPSHAVMPGVLLIEAMAQAAGLLGWLMLEKDDVVSDSIYYFAGADKVRFRSPVIPGDQVFLYANYVARKREVWKFYCTAIVTEKIVCCAEITCARKGELL